MNWQKPEMKQLVDGMLSLESPTEVRLFLRDLMTEGELEDFAKRLETARMLSAAIPYPSIQLVTGFSTTTIARVSKWLQTGGGGYNLVLNRLHHTHSNTHSGVRGLR